MAKPLKAGVALALGGILLSGCSTGEVAAPGPNPSKVPAASAPTEGTRWYLTQGAGEIRPKYVYLWSQGVASTEVTGGGQLVVRASGDQCQGAPEVEVRVGDYNAGTIRVANLEGKQPYPLDGVYTTGTHKVSFLLTNDFQNESCDRNVSLYSVEAQGDPTNPFLQGKPYADPQYGARLWAEAKKKPNLSPRDKLFLQGLARRTNGIWLGSWTQGRALDQAVGRALAGASKGKQTPVFVLYGMGGCLGKNPKSLNPAEYLPWVDSFISAVGTSRAAVVLEPDALPFSSTPRCAANKKALTEVATRLSWKKNLSVYLDAGHPKWLSDHEALRLMREVGVERLRGFSLNVANTQKTEATRAYGDKLATSLNVHYVIDTSRNGGKSTLDTCNPTGVAPGTPPRVFPSGPLDALLWIKPQGESDGTCKGAPKEGTFWLPYALTFLKGVSASWLLEG